MTKKTVASHNRRNWPTKAEAKLAVGAWIEERYNRVKRHASIGRISPKLYEQGKRHAVGRRTVG